MVSTSDICDLEYADGYTFDKYGNVIAKDVEGNYFWRQKLRDQCRGNYAAQQREMELCAESPVYWINAWVWTFNVIEVRNGVTMRASKPHSPFVTWPVQDKVIEQIVDCIEVGADVIIDKSRDMGATWLLLAIAYYYWLFKPDSQMLFLSRSEDDIDKSGDPLTLYYKIDYITRKLPTWMLPCDRDLLLRGGMYRQHMHLTNPKINTSIDGEATGEHATKGDRRTFVVLDEMAAMPHAAAAWAAASDVTSCKIGNSTPAGPGTEFSRQRNLGLERGHPVVVNLGYYNHPQKGQGRERRVDEDGSVTGVAGREYWWTPWFAIQAARRDKTDLCQNVLMDHMGSGDGVFNSVMVTRHMSEHGKDGVKCSLEFDGKKWRFVEDDAGPWTVWCKLSNGIAPLNTNYVIFADPSYGKGAANTAAAVHDRETGEAVAEYADPWATPGDLVEELVPAGKYVFKGQADSALLGWEENGPGEAMYQEILRESYPLIYYREKLGQDGKTKEKAYGWRSDRRSKRILMSMFGRAMMKGRVTVHSRECLSEMLRYSYYDDGSIGLASLKDETTGAREAHGDRVVAHAGAAFLASQAPRFEDRAPRYPPGSLGEIAEHQRWADGDEDKEAKDWYDT